MENKPRKVVKGGQVAVLISPGFGAGWSTWNSEHRDLLLFDRAFVEAAEAGVTDIDDIVVEVTKDKHVYCGGWRDVEIVWVPEGTHFTVEEYDGSERLHYLSAIAIVA